MIIEEELNPENLAQRAKLASDALDHEIKRLEAGDERKPPSVKGNIKLRALVEDYQELVHNSKKYLASNPANAAIAALANKAVESWAPIRLKIKRYNELALEYNKTHSPKLETIEERTGFEITESVKYFDY